MDGPLKPPVTVGYNTEGDIAATSPSVLVESSKRTVSPNAIV